MGFGQVECDAGEKAISFFPSFSLSSQSLSNIKFIAKGTKKVLKYNHVIIILHVIQRHLNNSMLFLTVEFSMFITYFNVTIKTKIIIYSQTRNAIMQRDGV